MGGLAAMQNTQNLSSVMSRGRLSNEKESSQHALLEAGMKLVKL